MESLEPRKRPGTDLLHFSEPVKHIACTMYEQPEEMLMCTFVLWKYRTNPDLHGQPVSGSDVPGNRAVMSDYVLLCPIQCCERILECIFCSTQSFLLHVRSAGTRKQPRGGGKAVSKASTPSPFGIPSLPIR